jgi:hypothetical protein
MEKPILYVKNAKGRYERWREPEPPFANALYRKYVFGKKVYYKPVSMSIEKDLDEGVWVITKHIYGKNYSTGRYLRDCFMCQKACDIQETPLSKLGGMDKLADWLSHNLDKLPKNTSQYDFCRAIVGLLFQYETKDDGNK